jgi:hypothetical protein
MTPLLLAAEKGYSLLLLTLLQNGADVNFQGWESGNSALHVACI